MCWSKIKAYLHKRKFERERKELLKKIAQDIQKQQAKRKGVPVATSRGGPNMPKHQSCPQCHAGSERGTKTMGGAYYICPTHGEFFVRRERQRSHRPVHQHSK